MDILESGVKRIMQPQMKYVSLAREILFIQQQQFPFTRRHHTTCVLKSNPSWKNRRLKMCSEVYHSTPSWDGKKENRDVLFHTPLSLVFLDASIYSSIRIPPNKAGDYSFELIMSRICNTGVKWLKDRYTMCRIATETL